MKKQEHEFKSSDEVAHVVKFLLDHPEGWTKIEIESSGGPGKINDFCFTLVDEFTPKYDAFVEGLDRLINALPVDSVYAWLTNRMPKAQIKKLVKRLNKYLEG